MIVLAHKGQTSITRYRRDKGHEGRYWVLDDIGNDTEYDVASEHDDLDKAKRKLKGGKQPPRSGDYIGIFDVLTHEMWMLRKDEKLEKKEIEKVFDRENGWID